MSRISLDFRLSKTNRSRGSKETMIIPTGLNAVLSNTNRKMKLLQLKIFRVNSKVADINIKI